MDSTWKDATSTGTDVAQITGASIAGATVKKENTYYVKTSGTVDFDVVVGTLTKNTTLTFQVSNSTATPSSNTKALTTADNGKTAKVTGVSMGASITGDITVNVKVTDT